MNLVLRQTLSRNTFRLYDGLVHKCVVRKLPVITLQCPLQFRYYSQDRAESIKLPQLMNFPPIVWPSFIKFIRNWMFATFIIKPYFDNEFSLPDFIEASKHAVQVVSGALQRSDYNALEGLVKQEALVVLKNAVSNLSIAQREMLSVDVDDIYYAFPYQVGVMFDDSDKRWVEITMCYHVLKGLKSITESGDLPPLSLGVQPEYQDKFYILNYRFIREFTKGVEDSWWINIVNHFQPRTVVRKI